ncbi:ribosome maturation factor, partial [Klebsiella oxytoca]
MSITDTVYEIAEPISKELNFELVDVEYVNEGKNWFLRVYIDKAGGVNLDDCTLMSEQLGEALDSKEEDPIPQAYYLEVSSPGAEKPIKNEEALKAAIGEYIHVKLYNQIGVHNTF